MTPENLTAAVDLHRPVGYDKHAYKTDKPEEVKHWRCDECQKNVDARGCRTWQTANR